jgi:hypothetical protein
MPQRLILEDEHNQIYQVLIESTAPASPQPTQNNDLESKVRNNGAAGPATQNGAG